MRVLLREGAERPSAESIVIFPHEIETSPVTLCGEAARGGIVAEADTSPLEIVNRLITRCGPQADEPEKLIWEVTWMAKALGPYEVGSRIGIHLFANGWSLDTSEATPIDRAPGLAEGDAISIGPPQEDAFVNARGTVASLAGELVWVELDAGDRERIERTVIKRLPRRMSFPRLCVERVG